MGEQPGAQDRDRRIADLARCDLLAGSNPEDLQQLADLLIPVSAAAGAVLIHQGKPRTDSFLDGRPGHRRLRDAGAE